MAIVLRGLEANDKQTEGLPQTPKLSACAEPLTVKANGFAFDKVMAIDLRGLEARDKQPEGLPQTPKLSACAEPLTAKANGFCLRSGNGVICLEFALSKPRKRFVANSVSQRVALARFPRIAWQTAASPPCLQLAPFSPHTKKPPHCGGFYWRCWLLAFTFLPLYHFWGTKPSGGG
jgi:hypothetical protein